MLNQREVSVMKVVFDACKRNNGPCIVANNFLLQSVPEKHKLDNIKLDVILKQLEYDGYFECTKSLKDGATVNVIALKQKGKAFERELVQRKRELVSTALWRVIFAAVGAVVALVIQRVF